MSNIVDIHPDPQPGLPALKVGMLLLNHENPTDVHMVMREGRSPTFNIFSLRDGEAWDSPEESLQALREALDRDDEWVVFAGSVTITSGTAG